MRWVAVMLEPPISDPMVAEQVLPDWQQVLAIHNPALPSRYILCPLSLVIVVTGGLCICAGDWNELCRSVHSESPYTLLHCGWLGVNTR